MHKILIIVGVFCPVFVTNSVVAQEKTEESFIPNYAVANSYFTWSDAADFSSGSGSVSQQEAGLEANVPLFTTEKFRVTGGVRYRWNQLDFSGAAFPFESQSFELHRVDLPFNVWADFNDRWKLWIRLQPGIYSDFGDVSSDDFILTSLALLSYRWSDSVKIAFGGFYSKDLGEERALPALGLIFEPSPHWSLALTFPRVELAWSPNQDWLFTGRAVLSGAGWNITDPQGTGEDVDLNYRSVSVAIGIDRRLNGPWWVYFDAGVQLAQEIEIAGGGYDFAEELDPSIFVSAGVKLRF
ncbi:MAG: hypothetical protein ACI8UO_006730 [Verrucomicrobiales bacterium]|jgi:hypothetical protein